MADMENVIKWLEEISDYFFDIYRNDTDSYKCEMALQRSDAAIDAIAMLKEQKGLMLSLEQSNAANGYLNAEVERLNGLLKEQEAEITKMNKWEELRNTIQEMYDNNSDKPDVVTTMQFLLNLMEVKDGR